MHQNAVQLAVLVLAGLYAVSRAEISLRKWGVAVSQEDCTAQGQQRLEDILAGKVEPYAFYGPPESECTADGCQHDYWGSRCRWTGKKAPACPEETRNALVDLLKDYARNGADWAAEALTLQPCQLWEQVRGRTTWFVGDSVSQETAHTFICFLLEYYETSKQAPKISGDSTLMHRLSHNANNKEMTTWCTLFKEDTRVCMLRANFGPRMANVMIPALTQVTSPLDIVVLNFGLWSNSMEELRLHVSMFESAMAYHKSQLPNRTFWRETSAQHYSTLSGMYNTSLPIFQQQCRPIFPGTNLTIAVNGSLIRMPKSAPPQQWSLEDWELGQVLQGGYRNIATQPAADRLGLHTIRTWNTSVALWDFHHHVHFPNEPQPCAKVDCDCTHACNPSWSQIWLPGFRNAFANGSLYIEGGKQAPWLDTDHGDSSNS